mmetsp:Transcript_64082/g.171605  ORF Transcript_64082/g.171605 Transcript_64082/m.171605 type:complete len:82 (+) Transcript_64082:1-246(+)
MHYSNKFSALDDTNGNEFEVDHDSSEEDLKEDVVVPAKVSKFEHILSAVERIWLDRPQRPDNYRFRIMSYNVLAASYAKKK